MKSKKVIATSAALAVAAVQAAPVELHNTIDQAIDCPTDTHLQCIPSSSLSPQHPGLISAFASHLPRLPSPTPLLAKIEEGRGHQLHLNLDDVPRHEALNHLIHSTIHRFTSLPRSTDSLILGFGRALLFSPQNLAYGHHDCLFEPTSAKWIKNHHGRGRSFATNYRILKRGASVDSLLSLQDGCKRSNWSGRSGHVSIYSSAPDDIDRDESLEEEEEQDGYQADNEENPPWGKKQGNKERDIVEDSLLRKRGIKEGRDIEWESRSRFSNRSRRSQGTPSPSVSRFSRHDRNQFSKRGEENVIVLETRSPHRSSDHFSRFENSHGISRSPDRHSSNPRSPDRTSHFNQDRVRTTGREAPSPSRYDRRPILHHGGHQFSKRGVVDEEAKDVFWEARSASHSSHFYRSPTRFVHRSRHSERSQDRSASRHSHSRFYKRRLTKDRNEGAKVEKRGMDRPSFLVDGKKILGKRDGQDNGFVEEQSVHEIPTSNQNLQRRREEETRRTFEDGPLPHAGLLDEIDTLTVRSVLSAHGEMFPPSARSVESELGFDRRGYYDSEEGKLILLARAADLMPREPLEAEEQKDLGMVEKRDSSRGHWFHRKGHRKDKRSMNEEDQGDEMEKKLEKGTVEAQPSKQDLLAMQSKRKRSDDQEEAKWTKGDYLPLTEQNLRARDLMDTESHDQPSSPVLRHRPLGQDRMDKMAKESRMPPQKRNVEISKGLEDIENTLERRSRGSHGGRRNRSRSRSRRALDEDSSLDNDGFKRRWLGQAVVDVEG